jgi:hypothetical protein
LPAVLFFFIFQQAPTLLIVLLGVIVWLAVVEVRGQQEMPLLQKVWWVLFVLLLIILRIYTYAKAKKTDSAP